MGKIDSAAFAIVAGRTSTAAARRRRRARSKLPTTIPSLPAVLQSRRCWRTAPRSSASAQRLEECSLNSRSFVSGAHHATRLLFAIAADDEIAHHQHVHRRALETGNGLVRRANNRFILVERGVEEQRHARPLAESIDQLPV